MSFLDNGFEKFFLYETVIEDDGRFGIPVKASVLFDKDNFKIKKGYSGTPVMIYVINTGAKRVGTLSDSEIVSGMLKRGHVVTVLDYLDGKKAPAGYMLDLSVQGIRQKIMKGELFATVDALGQGSYPETLVVPSGCDASYGNVYWEFDKHGADGTLEKIVEIWNNDFRGTKGESLIKWVDAEGNRKSTQTAHDGSEPQWCAENGEPDANGSYLRVKHTLANDVTDCAKPDGTMIDLKLYMHIVYPTAPKGKVPVMCLAASSENLCSNSASADRPHMNGFVFDGYAGVMYDYPYTPMARLDHYGYFDGYPKKGYITGDNATYSLKTYNPQADMAAMRFIRYLALSEGEKYRFDTEAIGVYGNSKGGWTTYLGEKDPEAMPPQRIFKGHHGETRYENGDTESRKGVNGGEEQPWLTYNGKKIESGVQLVYSSCGAVWYAITKGHCPLFISCNRRDESCFSTSNAMVNAGRVHGIPTMWLEIPLPHTIVYGEDLHYGIDAYKAFFDCAGYHLRHDAVKAVGVRVNRAKFPVSFTVLFSGSVSRAEAEKMTVTDANGNVLDGVFTGEYGDCEWTFTPSVPVYGEGYTLTVPAGTVGKNGKPSENGYSFKVDFNEGVIDNAVTERINSYKKRAIAFEVIGDGNNTVCAYNGKSECVGKTNVSGSGWYKIDVTDVKLSLDGITLKAERSTPEAICSSFTLSGRANGGQGVAPDGKVALKVEGFKTVTSYPTEEFYAYLSPAVSCADIVKADALDENDLGRRFKISFKVYDTASRYISFGLNHCSKRTDSVSDYLRVMSNERTRKGEWVEYTLDYTVYELIFGECGKQKKSFAVSCTGMGEADSPIYFADLKCEEILSSVKTGRICFVGETDEKHLPLGQSDIVCEKSPWSK